MSTPTAVSTPTRQENPWLTEFRNFLLAAKTYFIGTSSPLWAAWWLNQSFSETEIDAAWVRAIEALDRGDPVVYLGPDEPVRACEIFDEPDLAMYRAILERLEVLGWHGGQGDA